MAEELALYIRFQADDRLLDIFFDMLEVNELQFCGGGNGRIIFAYEDGEGEVPPVIEGLLRWLIRGDEVEKPDIFGYIRSKSRKSLTDGQRRILDEWLRLNAECFEVEGLRDVWKKAIND